MSSTSSTGSDKGERGDEQESTCTSHSEGGQWIYHPVIQPLTTEQCETLPALPVIGVQFQGVVYSSNYYFMYFSNVNTVIIAFIHDSSIFLNI